MVLCRMHTMELTLTSEYRNIFNNLEVIHARLLIKNLHNKTKKLANVNIMF